MFFFKLDVPSEDRYTVPLDMGISPHQHGPEPRYELKITNNDTFSFQIIRQSSQTVMWEFVLFSLIGYQWNTETKTGVYLLLWILTHCFTEAWIDGQEKTIFSKGECNAY